MKNSTKSAWLLTLPMSIRYRAQRLYTDRSWPNPVVLKLTHVEAAMLPPQVVTLRAEWDARSPKETLYGNLAGMGSVERVEVGFQYRVKKDGTDLSERNEPWTDLPTTARTTTSEFRYTVEALTPNREYEFRAQVKHPLFTTYGEEKLFERLMRLNEQELLCRVVSRHHCVVVLRRRWHRK